MTSTELQNDKLVVRVPKNCVKDFIAIRDKLETDKNSAVLQELIKVYKNKNLDKLFEILERLQLDVGSLKLNKI